MAAGRNASVDWAESRLGRRWGLRSEADLEGRVIAAGDWAATPDGLRVMVAMRHPWCSLNQGERWIDARRFHRLRLWARADSPGEIELTTRTPADEFPEARGLLRVGTEWRCLEADLARADWRGAKKARARWGGAEGLIRQLGMRLAFPVGEKGIVQVRDVSLLGDRPTADAPPHIDPLPDEGGRLRFRITDPAGVWSGGLLIAVNGIVFDLRSRAVEWDGQVLSWDGPHVCDEHPSIYVEAANREGIRGSLELHRMHPR